MLNAPPHTHPPAHRYLCHLGIQTPKRLFYTHIRSNLVATNKARPRCAWASPLSEVWKAELSTPCVFDRRECLSWAIHMCPCSQDIHNIPSVRVLWRNWHSNYSMHIVKTCYIVALTLECWRIGARRAWLAMAMGCNHHMWLKSLEHASSGTYRSRTSIRRKLHHMYMSVQFP